MLQSSFRRARRGRHFVIGCCVAVLVAACGGNGELTSSMGGTKGGGVTTGMAAGSGLATPLTCPGSCGTSMLTTTDAAGDFLSYIVSLTSLQLQTAGGASVETLPGAAQIDFTKLVNLAEVLTILEAARSEREPRWMRRLRLTSSIPVR